MSLSRISPTNIEIQRAGGTIPACDRVLLAFGMSMAVRYDWNMEWLCKFLANPAPYQKDWQDWLRAQQWAEHKITTEEVVLP